MLAEQARADQQTIVHLTERPFRYLRFLSGQRRAAITGCAGSGKTFLLEAAGIPFEYEPRLPYTDDQGRTRFIHPDFYLYEHGLYVEYWGRDGPEYVESRRFKEGVYERLVARRGLRVLHLEAGDVKNDVFMGKVRAAIGDDS